MAKFELEQLAGIAAIKQVVYEWGDQLDLHDGMSIVDANILTSDVRYCVGGEWREGLANVGEFYKGRMARLKEADAVPVMRHIISNLKIDFSSDTEAKVDFLLVFFAKAGEPPFSGYCDPLAVADVWMKCRKEEDGHWRICEFNSQQMFMRG